jgi:ferredoxin-thioredoxin reductase catalytic chain
LPSPFAEEVLRTMREPSEKSLTRMKIFVGKYLEKTGTSRHPTSGVTEAVVNGLASNLDDLGRPLCPCKFFPDKKAEIERSREWICACDDMKTYKYCHCLLFVAPDGLPITEYLPEGHEGRQAYGVVKDPTVNPTPHTIPPSC